jgi:hypothetical protein
MEAALIVENLERAARDQDLFEQRNRISDALACRSGCQILCRPAPGAPNLTTNASFTLALQIAQHLDFGTCHINGPTVYEEAHVPLCGMKAIGWGRFRDPPGIHEFTEIQWVAIEDPSQAYPIDSVAVGWARFVSVPARV